MFYFSFVSFGCAPPLPTPAAGELGSLGHLAVLKFMTEKQQKKLAEFVLSNDEILEVLLDAVNRMLQDGAKHGLFKGLAGSSTFDAATLSALVSANKARREKMRSELGLNDATLN
jgi:hypothetical protein